MKNDHAMQVLICGAGAAGLTLAIELARRGITFRLIDKMEGPFPGSRGKGIQPRTQEVFEDLGVINRLVAIGGLYPLRRQYRADGSFTESSFGEQAAPTPAEPWQLPLLVPQFLTERVLRERLLELGHAVEFGHELIDLVQDGDGVSATVAGHAGTEVVRVRYLIGADGGRSFVRHALGIGFPGKTLGIRAVVADVVLSGLDRDAWHCFNEGAMDRQMSLCPLAGTALFQLQAPIPLEGDIDLSAAALSAMVAARTGRADIRIESVSWASAFHMNARLADRYRGGSVFLVGDAAHVHPPTGGQGLNTSVQDACNLGWKLAAVCSGAPHALLDSYEEERRPVAADVLGLASRLLEAAKQGVMRRGREVHQLDLGYAGSSLAPASKGQRSLLAGNRAPDAPVLGAAGQPTRLFDLFKGIHWTLLTYAVNGGLVSPRTGLHIHTLGGCEFSNLPVRSRMAGRESVTPVDDSRERVRACTGHAIEENHRKGLSSQSLGACADYADEGDHFRNAYDLAEGDWVLVRPDGYVGAIGAGDEIDALENYLREVGLAASAHDRA